VNDRACSGSEIAIGTNTGHVQVWDTARGAKIRDLHSHTNRVGALAWSSSLLATGSRDRTIQLQDLRVRGASSAINTSISGSSGSITPGGGGSIMGNSPGRFSVISGGVRRTIGASMSPSPAVPGAGMPATMGEPRERLTEDDDDVQEEPDDDEDSDADADADVEAASTSFSIESAPASLPSSPSPANGLSPSALRSTISPQTPTRSPAPVLASPFATAASLALPPRTPPSSRSPSTGSVGAVGFGGGGGLAAAAGATTPSASLISLLEAADDYVTQGTQRLQTPISSPGQTTRAAARASLLGISPAASPARPDLNASTSASGGGVNTSSCVVQTLLAHQQEVCGLKWSHDERMLASGGNDNMLHIWCPAANTSSAHRTGSTPGSGSTTLSEPLFSFSDHVAAVKAVAWSPHQHGLVASGGGTADRHIRLECRDKFANTVVTVLNQYFARFWSALTGTALHRIDTGSQVCNLLWSRTANEMVSTHGYSLNQVIVWKYPSMQKLATLSGHSLRLLFDIS
jgi:hypothetical protein